MTKNGIEGRVTSVAGEDESGDESTVKVNEVGTNIAT